MKDGHKLIFGYVDENGQHHYKILDQMQLEDLTHHLRGRVGIFAKSYVKISKIRNAIGWILNYLD